MFSARLLRDMKRFSEALLELNSIETVLTDMEATEHPERHFVKAWSLCFQILTFYQAGDILAAKALLPEAEKLIHDHDLEDLAKGLSATRKDIENAEASGG